MKITTANSRKLRRGRRGQGMTEYIIIVALIAIAAIGVITVFGNNIRRLFSASADALAGVDNVANPNTAGAGKNFTQKNMKTFGNSAGAQ